MPEEVLLQLEILNGAKNKWTFESLRVMIDQYVRFSHSMNRPKLTYFDRRPLAIYNSIVLTYYFCKTGKLGWSKRKRAEENVLVPSGEMVLMQTAKTEIQGHNISERDHVRILFDSGSQKTYVTENLAEKLKLKRESREEIK